MSPMRPRPLPLHPADIPVRRTPIWGAALEDEHLSLDNAGLAEAVAAFAEAFGACGVERGDVVAAMLPNRVELVVTMFAAWRLGAAFTPINPALTLNEARHQLEDSRARLVVVDPASAKVLATTTVTQVAVDDLPLAASGPAVERAAQDHDTALLIYTSGSTGRPKGVILDHANVAAMINSTQQCLGFSADDRALLILPLFHVNALLVSILAPLAAGGSSMVLERFDRHAFWGAVTRHQPTYFSAVPAIYILLNQGPADETPDLSRLRFVICGAAPMPAAAIAEFETRYGVPLLEGYGLTESTVGATLNPLEGPRKAGTVGLPMPGVRIRILDDAGRSVAAGAVGEVSLSGANVMRGYLNQADETAKALAGGWLRTGDLGFFDPDGYLVLVDRKKDMIIRGGENIYPKEIETVLYDHPAVAEVAVVGRPDAVMGEEVVAFVSLRPDMVVDSASLIAFAAERLAKFKLPKELRFLAALPKNPVGKIAKPDLRAALRKEA